MDPVEVQVPQNPGTYAAPGPYGYYQPPPGLGQNLEHSAARSIDTISGCGGVSTVLLLFCLISIAFNVMQYWVGRKTVEQMLNMLPAAAAAIQAAVNDFKESMRNAIRNKDD